MLDIKLIREKPEEVKKSMKARQQDPTLVDEVLELDEKRRKIMGEVENLRAERNRLSQEQAEEARAKGREIKKKLKELEVGLREVNEKYKGALNHIPNLLAPEVPEGRDETENKPLRKWGEPTKFDFKPKDHLEIGEALDIIDTKTAAKVTGSGFGYLKGAAALLEFAIVQHAFSVLTDEKVLKIIAGRVESGYSSKPFIPVVPPMMIKEGPYDKMARLHPKEERYYIPSDDLYLIGSAEHTLGSMHMDETFNEKDLPIRYVGFSAAFRREAGSYGKDVRGIFRVHQFDKVEMESFTLPENSIKEQNFFVEVQEYLIQSLEIPYQVVLLCTGDMGDPDYRQIDIEAWIPSQEKYRETHTADLMTDYQARRLNTKVRRGNETEFVHMNDATVFAIGRTIIAILENYQQKDGSVKIPKVLQKYLGFEEIRK